MDAGRQAALMSLSFSILIQRMLGMKGGGG